MIMVFEDLSNLQLIAPAPGESLDSVKGKFGLY
jgi:hypothetical protein